MHDGRFATLREVIDHYDSGVRDSANLSPVLRGPDGTPRRLNLTEAEKLALLAFLGALTDDALLADPKFADPFPR
jgi:cytochrome c peroxidase